MACPDIKRIRVRLRWISIILLVARLDAPPFEFLDTLLIKSGRQFGVHVGAVREPPLPLPERMARLN